MWCLLVDSCIDQQQRVLCWTPSPQTRKKLKQAGPMRNSAAKWHQSRPSCDTSFILVCQTTPAFSLDRDCIVQGAIDRDFDLAVYFGGPLRVQGLKWTFSLFSKPSLRCGLPCENRPRDQSMASFTRRRSTIQTSVRR